MVGGGGGGGGAGGLVMHNLHTSIYELREECWRTLWNLQVQNI